MNISNILKIGFGLALAIGFFLLWGCLFELIRLFIKQRSKK